MNSIPNILSLLRLPLALLFFQNNIMLRVAAVIIAAVTDGLDGFIARRYKLMSRAGTILDPFTDKLFVLCVIGTFIYEGQLSYLEASSFFCRDIAIAIFGLYLFLTSQWEEYKIRAFWCGKITTTIQFGALILLSFKESLPSFISPLFLFLGIASLVELYFFKKNLRIN